MEENKEDEKVKIVEETKMRRINKLEPVEMEDFQ